MLYVYTRNVFIYLFSAAYINLAQQSRVALSLFLAYSRENARGAIQRQKSPRDLFGRLIKRHRGGRLVAMDVRVAYSRTKKKCLEGEAAERDSRGSGGGGGGDGDGGGRGS